MLFGCPSWPDLILINPSCLVITSGKNHWESGALGTAFIMRKNKQIKQEGIKCGVCLNSCNSGVSTLIQSYYVCAL